MHLYTLSTKKKNLQAISEAFNQNQNQNTLTPPSAHDHDSDFEMDAESTEFGTLESNNSSFVYSSYITSQSTFEFQSFHLCLIFIK